MLKAGYMNDADSEICGAVMRNLERNGIATEPLVFRQYILNDVTGDIDLIRPRIYALIPEGNELSGSVGWFLRVPEKYAEIATKWCGYQQSGGIVAMLSSQLREETKNLELILFEKVNISSLRADLSPILEHFKYDRVNLFGFWIPPRLGLVDYCCFLVP